MWGEHHGRPVEHLYGKRQLIEGGSSRWVEPGEGKHAANINRLVMSFLMK